MSHTYAHSTTATVPEITKRIAYNHDTRDYDCFVAIDGGEEQYIGSAGTYGQSETKCNSFVYEFYTDTCTPEKAIEFIAADEDEAPSEAEEAAEDAANQQKVYELVMAAMGDKGASLFVDTIPGRVNNIPIDLVIAIGIGAAMERNLSKLGITRDQLFAILEVAVNPIVEKHLITPARRMRLIWDGME